VGLLRCDYLVVGAGATGMAFVDTLLAHHPGAPSVVILDRRPAPGGHWNDSYPYVTLHQSCVNYGVESEPLEAAVADTEELLATRGEILAYYGRVMERFVAQHGVTFLPGIAYDFASGACEPVGGGGAGPKIEAATVVDARFTEPDLPVHVAPTFEYDPAAVDVVPPNGLPAPGESVSGRRYCVVGAGKTGQDTIIYLQTKLGVDPSDIAWVMPHQPWITARQPPMDTCMEFLHTALDAAADGSGGPAATSLDFVQEAYLALEAQGKVYRLDPEGPLPTKFLNATLNGAEVELLRRVPSSNVLRQGRVASIAEGSLVFADGSTAALPWAQGGDAAASTTFVHCSAGAFNLSASAAQARAERPPVFAPGKITVQEVFSYPGFCFNGAMVARLECEPSLGSLEAKNAMAELPEPGPAPAPGSLGPSGGTVGPLHAGHPLLIALRNARRWYASPPLAEWLAGSRLYALTMNGYGLAEGRALVDANWRGLVAAGVVSEEDLK